MHHKSEYQTLIFIFSFLQSNVHDMISLYLINKSVNIKLMFHAYLVERHKLEDLDCEERHGLEEQDELVKLPRHAEQEGTRPDTRQVETLGERRRVYKKTC